MIRSGPRWPVDAAIAALTFIAGIASLHVLHATAGHVALGMFGPAIALVMAGTIALLPYPGVRREIRLLIGSYTLLLILGGEWLESELTAGHDVASALAAHGRLVGVAIGVAAGIAALAQAALAVEALLSSISRRRDR